MPGELAPARSGGLGRFDAVPGVPPDAAAPPLDSSVICEVSMTDFAGSTFS